MILDSIWSKPRVRDLPIPASMYLGYATSVLTRVSIPSLGYETPNNQTSASIIFIHGLNGSPTRSWQDSNTECIWFQDMLPFYVASPSEDARARIWTFGYNANIFFGAAPEAGVVQYAQQLLERITSIRKGCEVGMSGFGLSHMWQMFTSPSITKQSGFAIH